MAISVDQFKEGMRQLGGAVTIVSCADEDISAGLTATAITSLSAEPPRLLACINRQGATYATISRGRNFCVNVLAMHHKTLAEKFAGMDGTPETERFDGGLWGPIKTGAPALKDAIVAFDCLVDSILDVGSHGIVIGDIVGVKIASDADDAASLCYKGGDWSTLVPLAL